MAVLGGDDHDVSFRYNIAYIYRYVDFGQLANRIIRETAHQAA